MCPPRDVDGTPTRGHVATLLLPVWRHVGGLPSIETACLTTARVCGRGYYDVQRADQTHLLLVERVADTGQMTDSASGQGDLDIVICTFDNAVMLHRVLAALGAQRGAAGRWSVLVVDNNSTDDTQDVISRHLTSGAVPGLRCVREQRQGLTPARLRGVRSTTAPWIAFVDDDCVLDEGWVAGAIDFIREHPESAAFGGRVVPTYVEEPPAVVARYGWAFAEQDLGDVPVPVDCLVGAGMVINRAALEESGWSEEPFFADRVGRKLVSGGDVEIALRLAGTGRPLWYTPACVLQHVIPPRRTAMPYLVRMTCSLGVSHSLAQALTWRAPRRAWARQASSDLLRSLLGVAGAAKRTVDGPEGRQDFMLASSYELGRWKGIARVALLAARGRCEFFGGDRPRSARLGGHAVRAA